MAADGLGLDVSAVLDQELHQIHAVHHHRKRQQLAAVPLHQGAAFEEQLHGARAAAADGVAQQRDFLEVVGGIDGVDMPVRTVPSAVSGGHAW